MSSDIDSCDLKNKTCDCELQWKNTFCKCTNRKRVDGA